MSKAGSDQLQSLKQGVTFYEYERSRSRCFQKEEYSCNPPSRRYKCQDKYAQKFSYKYVQFILLSILSRFLGKGAEADKIFLLL